MKKTTNVQLQTSKTCEYSILDSTLRHDVLFFPHLVMVFFQPETIQLDAYRKIVASPSYEGKVTFSDLPHVVTFRPELNTSAAQAYLSVQYWYYHCRFSKSSAFSYYATSSTKTRIDIIYQR
jgi:hypothetical protein